MIFCWNCKFTGKLNQLDFIIIFQYIMQFMFLLTLNWRNCIDFHFMWPTLTSSLSPDVIFQLVMFIHIICFSVAKTRFPCHLLVRNFSSTEPRSNGKEVPRYGVAKYRRWVPHLLGGIIVVTNSPPIGLMRSQLTNHQLGIVLVVGAWSEKLY